MIYGHHGLKALRQAQLHRIWSIGSKSYSKDVSQNNVKKFIFFFSTKITFGSTAIQFCGFFLAFKCILLINNFLMRIAQKNGFIYKYLHLHYIRNRTAHITAMTVCDK